MNSPLGDEHPRPAGSAAAIEPDQRGDRGPDRDPLDRHPHQVGERGAPRGDGRVEVGRPARRPAPVVDRGGHRVGGRRRWDADARGVEVAVGDVELRPNAVRTLTNPAARLTSWTRARVRPWTAPWWRSGPASREAVVDLGGEIERFLRSVGAREGLLNVWVPHATAGLAVIETGAGSDTDLLAALRDLLPADDRWRHRHGSAGHGRDHVLPRSSRRRCRCRCSTGGRRWAPGSRSAWSTPTATTRCGRSGCRSCRAEPVASGRGARQFSRNGHGADGPRRSLRRVGAAGRDARGGPRAAPVVPGRRAAPRGHGAAPHPALPWLPAAASLPPGRRPAARRASRAAPVDRAHAGSSDVVARLGRAARRACSRRGARPRGRGRRARTAAPGPVDDAVPVLHTPRRAGAPPRPTPPRRWTRRRSPASSTGRATLRRRGVPPRVRRRGAAARRRVRGLGRPTAPSASPGGSPPRRTPRPTAPRRRDGRAAAPRAGRRAGRTRRRHRHRGHGRGAGRARRLRGDGGTVLVLAAPVSGGAALLLVAGDTEGGPAEPAPPGPGDARTPCIASVRLGPP